MLKPDDSISVPKTEEPEAGGRNSAQWMIASFLVMALVTGGLFYRFILIRGLGHTSLMFIGIPLVLAILLVLAPTPKTATGSILRGMTLALLVVAPLVGEGYLCILFASPLFLGVGLLVGTLVDHLRAKRSTTLSCLALILLPISLEGVVPQLTHNRAQSVEVTEIVEAPESRVEGVLARSPDVATALPRFLRIGFPRPLQARGSGLALDSVRVIHFAGAEGDPPGDLVMRVAASRSGYVRFETVSDSSKLMQWVEWRSSEVTYDAVGGGRTRVTWRITYNRELDPYWYFAPWEQFAVRQAARYLIDANATPRS